MNDTSQAAVDRDDGEDDVLRTRIRLPSAIGPVYDHLVSLPSSQRATRIRQLLVLGYMYEVQLFRGSATGGGATMVMHPPEPTTPAISKRTSGASRPRSAPDSGTQKAVTEAVSVARTTALERIGSLGAILPGE